jgi:hypothetical protein
MRSRLSVVATVTTLASADVAPVALFHGIHDNCPGQQAWINLIIEGINNEAPVKCVEIG